MPSVISAILVSTAVSWALGLKVQLCVAKNSGLSIMIAHASAMKLMARTYTLKRRAEQQAETRQRLVEAAVDLPGAVGPARTTFSMVAERPGVQRHTLYAHFPDERTLLMACSGLVHEQDPPPSAEPWRGLADRDEP